MPNQQVVQDTLNLRNDIGFISYPESNKKLKTTQIIKHEIVFIMNAGHPLAKKDRLNVTDLEGQMIIMHEQGSYFQEMIHDLLENNNVRVNMPITFSNNEAIKKAVEGGTGISPISKKVAAKEIDSGKLIALSLTDTPLFRSFHMIRHKEKYISGPLKQFIRLFTAKIS